MWALVGVWYADPKAGADSRADPVNRVPARVFIAILMCIEHHSNSTQYFANDTVSIPTNLGKSNLSR